MDTPFVKEVVFIERRPSDSGSVAPEIMGTEQTYWHSYGCTSDMTAGRKFSRADGALNVFDRYGVVYAREPGIVLRMPVADDDRNPAVFGIEICGTLARNAQDFRAVAYTLSLGARDQSLSAAVCS